MLSCWDDFCNGPHPEAEAAPGSPRAGSAGKLLSSLARSDISRWISKNSISASVCKEFSNFRFTQWCDYFRVDFDNFWIEGHFLRLLWHFPKLIWTLNQTTVIRSQFYQTCFLLLLMKKIRFIVLNLVILLSMIFFLMKQTLKLNNKNRKTKKNKKLT